MILKRLGIMLMAATLQVQATADTAPNQVDQGIEAYNTQEYERAIELLEPLADKGVAEAQYFMGLMHFYGAGFELSPNAAQVWFRQAFDTWSDLADTGDLDAMVEVSLMLRNGFGVERDDNGAYTLLQRVLDQNPEFVRALSVMGDHYTDGIGVKENKTLGLEYYTQAANLGDEWGKMMLERLGATAPK